MMLKIRFNFLKFLAILYLVHVPIVHSMVETVGTTPCGQWVEERKKNSGWGGVVNERWLVGYLSGMAIGFDKDFLNGVDVKSIFLWMDVYCQQYPLSNTGEGGIKLTKELLKKIKQRVTE